MQEPPELFGKTVRFGCGALFGALAGAGLALELLIGDWRLLAVMVGCAALICGLLTMRWGYDIWSWVASLFGW